MTLVLLGVSLLGWGIDDRMPNGVSIWAKPIKFNRSFVLQLATPVVFVSVLRRDVQDCGSMRWTLILTAAAVLPDLLHIFVQAARGRASHFNVETEWETVACCRPMGGAAVVVMTGRLIVGLAALRGARRDIGPGLRTGIVPGAVVGTIATVVTAEALASGAVTPNGHWIGGELSDAGGLPITGWSTTGGDLRVSHFFATHLLQALPILGWFADRMQPRLAPLTVRAGTAAGVAIVWLTFTRALATRPFLSLAGP